MTILTAGGEMGAGIPADANCVEAGSRHDAAFARTSIGLFGFTTYYETDHVTESAEVFFHADWEQDSWLGSATAEVLNFYDDAGLAIARMQVTAPGGSFGTIQMQYLDTDLTTWTNAGTSFTISADNRYTLDIRINCDASGTVAIYSSGTLRNGGPTIDLSHLDGVSYARIYNTNSGYWSQIIIATESTIGHRLKTVPATGAGATTDWTGTYAEIDEIAYSDADFINSATNGQVELFSHSTTIPDGYRVKAVVVTARAKRGSTGPANLQLALRSSGTTYFTASQALDLGYGAFVGVWENDPATAAPFTASSIAALQFGVKAVT